MPPKDGKKAADKKKNAKYALSEAAELDPCDAQIRRYRTKYENICRDYGVDPIASFTELLRNEQAEWSSDGQALKGRSPYNRPAVGEKAKGGGDYPPNFPIIFNGCLPNNDTLSYAQTRAFIDSLGYWPRTWRGGENFGGMNFIGFWKCWGDGSNPAVCSGDDGAMLMMEFLKHDSLEPADLAKWVEPHRYSQPLCPSNGGKYACNLKNLEMIWCGITPEGCRLLGRALTQNETLKYLNLSHNPCIGDDGVETLGDGLKWNSSLETLKLEYCGIGWKGGEHVGRYIIRASSVRQLYLKGNNIGAKGVQGIASALAKNMTLQHLDLSDNCFGIHLDAIEALRDGIEANTSLTSINLNLNSMVPAGVTMLLEMLKPPEGDPKDGKEPKEGKTNIKDFQIYERCESELFQEIMTQVQANAKGKKGKKGKGKKK